MRVLASAAHILKIEVCLRKMCFERVGKKGVLVSAKQDIIFRFPT